MTGARILVVEDDAIVAMHLEMMLTRLGYQVVGIAATGENAVLLALGERPDAILMDVSLRGSMNGIQAAERIHQEADIPIIYQTAYTDDMLVDQAKTTDAYAYLAKPVRERELRASLEMALYKHGLEKRIAHLNLVLRATRNINHLITRGRDLQVLLEEACRILVNTREYCSVAFLRLEETTLEFYSSAGSGADFLSEVYRSASAEKVRDLPCTIAQLDRKVVVCRDMLEDDCYAPFRAFAEENSFKSSAAIPLSFGEGKPGVLCVFASQANMFDEEEVTLLEEVAGDITFGLKTLEDEAARRQTEVALRQSEERFSRAFHANPAGMVIVSLASNKVIDINQSLCEIYGYQPEEVIGRAGRDIDLYQDPAVREKLVEQFREKGRVHGFETTMRAKHGELRHMLGSMEKIEISGETCMLVAYYDITERKRSQQQLEELNRTLEQRVAERTAELADLYNNAPTGYHSLDENGVFVRINDTELRWFGYTREEVVGKLRAIDLLTPASVKIFQHHFPEFLACGFLHDLELEFLRKDGKILPVLLNATAVRDSAGKFLMSRSTVTDDSARRQAEAANQSLNRRLERRTRDLETSNNELEAFAYSVSHDLRAPLRAIDGFSAILEEDYSAVLDAQGHHYLALVRNNARKMDLLITDLLALARVSRIEIHFTPVDMTGLAHQAYSDVASAEVQESFDFRLGDLPEALGDPTLLRQVWVNLLSNAVKYTLPKALRWIEIGATVEDGQVVFFVKDNGVGFEEEYAGKLFGVFQRMHSAEAFEGNGVGLALVRRIINRHGGKTWAKGKVGEGATFYFSLPQRAG